MSTYIREREGGRTLYFVDTIFLPIMRRRWKFDATFLKSIKNIVWCLLKCMATETHLSFPSVQVSQYSGTYIIPGYPRYSNLHQQHDKRHQCSSNLINFRKQGIVGYF